MERIKHAAICFTLEGSTYPIIICGKYYSDIYEEMYFHKYYDKTKDICTGFLTSDNRFVDRQEAFGIALKNEQICLNSETESRIKAYGEGRVVLLNPLDISW